MAGTKLGGLKTKASNLARDPDYYRKLGRIGGKSHNKGGFAAMPRDQVAAAGRKGGIISRRTWTPERRAEHGEKARQVWERKKRLQREQGTS